jgi:DNA polymerase-3 subunit alpha
MYINDARAHDIEILPPDVNESLYLFNVIGTKIRFGMGAVKNVGAGPVAAIIAEREENGPFKGFIDFCERVSMKAVNMRTIEALIKVGGFDECEKLNRKTLLESTETIVTFAKKKQEEKANGQVNLFDMGGDSGEGLNESREEMLDINEVTDFDEKEKLSYEQQLLGVYVSGHPLDKFGDILKKLVSMEIAEIHDLPKMEAPPFDFTNKDARKNDPTKRNLTIAGLISEQKAILTKKGDRMAFVTIEDLSGKIECLVFPKTYAEYFEMLETDEPLVLEGYVKLSEDRRSFFVNKIRLVEDEADARVTAVVVKLDTQKLNEYSLPKLKQILLSYRGSVPAHLVFESEDGKAKMNLGENYLVNPTPQLAAKINELMNASSVSFFTDGKMEQITQQ